MKASSLLLFVFQVDFITALAPWDGMDWFLQNIQKRHMLGLPQGPMRIPHYHLASGLWSAQPMTHTCSRYES